MKLHTIIPLIILAIAIIMFIYIRKKKVIPNGNTIRIFNIIGICCGFLSMIFVLLSFYISPDKDISTLYKLSLPLLVIIIFFMNLKRKK